MNNRKAKTTAGQVEQTSPAETPETVEEQAVQAESETAANAAVQPAAPAETQEDPAPETPETVEEKVVQAESETAVEAAAQPAAPAETHEDPAPAIPKRPQIVAADSRGLNLRKGPHVSYDAITVLPDGTPVEIMNLPKDVEVPGWVLVETCAGIGWVNTNFLTEAEA